VSRGRTERIELIADASAAVVFSGAAAYAVLFALAPVPAGAAGALAFVAAFVGLRAVRPYDPGYALADFAVIPVEVEVLNELILTDADRLPDELILTDADRLPEPELLLEDVLRELPDNSRVVRLFDPAAMPTPGQLHTRIDRHLAGSDSSTASPDASQALHQALADLRRSLR